MTVEELIRQAMLKYRLFGPLSTNPDMNNEMTEEMIRDWYLTLQVNGSAEHILNPSENVIQILSSLQAPSPTSPSVQFGTTLYSPTVPSGKLPSKHHISRPILQVISPNDTNSVKLLLNQHSVIQKLLAESNNRLIKVVLYGEETVGTSASSKSRQHVVPIKPVPVRMVKTLKINVNLPASEVIALALEKFKKVEGKRSLGTVQEYELFMANDKLGDHGHDVMSLRGIERELRSLGSPLSPEKPLPNIQEKTKMMTFLLHDKRMRSLSREPENGNHKQQPKDVRTRTTIILPTTSNPSSSSSTNSSTSDSNASKTIQSSKPVNLTLPPPPASSPPVARSNSNSTPESSSSKPQSESTLRPKKKEHELVIPPARTSSIIQKSPSLPLLQSASRMPSSSQVQKPQLQRSYSSDSARSIDSTTGAPRIDIIGIEEVKTFDLDDLMGLVNSKKAEGTGDSLNTVPLNQAIQTEALNQPMAPSAEPEQIAHVNDTSVLGNSETLASPTTDISLTETDISTVDERVEEPNGVTESAESKEDALQTPEQHDHKFTKIDSAVNVAVATGSTGV
ncbi:hypothetical protein BKA69DRAFT_292802 [Paraphysoderma sedebokerense]|nr:hypothetical protein BKA69DRAFT_292802 [Paraphysoderma sedebokerense]